MNYTGGEVQATSAVVPLFPRAKTAVDLFTGGLNVALNLDAQRVICNDVNNRVIELYESLVDADPAVVLTYIDAQISRYALSKTNGSGYLRLRADYNARPVPWDLVVLAAFSFNHLIRFNGAQLFNTPFGKDRSSYNAAMREDLMVLIRELSTGRFEFSSLPFESVDVSALGVGDFVYADPPYLISVGSYNDGKRGFTGWTPDHDKALFDLLDRLDAAGVTFALSNVTHHKGLTNQPLLTWASRYTVHPIAAHYNNSNYQSKARMSATKEVLVTNSTGVGTGASS